MTTKQLQEIEAGREPTRWESIECTATLIVALAFCAGFWLCAGVAVWRAL